MFRKYRRVIMVSLYVDDLVIAESSLQSVIEMRKALCAHIEMKDCGEAKLCLGVKISRGRSERK